MIFVSTQNGYAHCTYEVRLEPHETTYSNLRLITLADRRNMLTDEEWLEIEQGGHPGHFGGDVLRHGDHARIKVYTD